MDYKLKKDIIIPEGTIMTESNVRLKKYDDGFHYVVLSLKEGTSGTLNYTIKDQALMDEYFEEII